MIDMIEAHQMIMSEVLRCSERKLCFQPSPGHSPLWLTENATAAASAA